MLNKDLVTAVANRVSDEDSVILFDILKKGHDGRWDLPEKTDILYQLCLNMLEDMEREEE